MCRTHFRSRFYLFDSLGHTVSLKKKRRVVVVLKEVCCLPRARVKDMKRELPALVEPSDYYSLLLFQIGNDEKSKGNQPGLQGLGTTG